MSIRDMIWGTGKQATQEEVIELTNQFYVTLRAYFTQIKKSGGASSRNAEAFQRIQALLEPAPDGKPPVQNWTNAYEVEQLLVHLYDDETVATELAVRILEARSILRAELAALYDVVVHDIDNPQAGRSAPETAARRRSVLGRLVNDLQWRYIVNEAKRRYSKLITRRTATLSVTALILFVVIVLVLATRGPTFTYSDMRLLWIAGLAGTWGATFSMLASLRTRLDQSKFDDLKLMKAASVLLSRAAIGAGAASILFFFLLSGLLGGTAFPILTKSEESRRVEAGALPSEPGNPAAPSPAANTETVKRQAPVAEDNVLPTRQLAMLIVWCFIAGFSEQLIPGLLASTEARAGAPVSPATTDRFRPTTGTATVPPAARTGEQGATAAQPAATQQRETPPPQGQGTDKKP